MNSLNSLKSLPMDVVNVISRHANYVLCGGKPVAYVKVKLKKRVTVSKNDQIYTCSNNARKIIVFDLRGNLIRHIKNVQGNENNFIAIQNIWAIDDELVVSDGYAADKICHLKIFTLDGVFRRSFFINTTGTEITEKKDGELLGFSATVDLICSITFVYSTVHNYYFIGCSCEQLQKEVFLIYTKNGEFVKEFQPKGDTVDNSDFFVDKDIVFVQNDDIYVRDQCGNLTIFDLNGNIKHVRICAVPDISYHFLKSFVAHPSKEYVELLIDEYDDLFKLNFFNANLCEREIIRFFIISTFVHHVAILSTGRFLLCVKHGFLLYE